MPRDETNPHLDRNSWVSIGIVGSLIMLSCILAFQWGITKTELSQIQREFAEFKASTKR